MNFYATRGFLDAAAAIYFKGRDTAIADVRIGNDTLRLLVVDGRRIVTKLQFLDFHQPLAPSEIGETVRSGRFAENVVRGTIVCGDAAVKDGKGEIAPYVDWSDFGDFDAYRELVLNRHRGFVRDRERRRRRLIADHGELTFAMNDTADDVFAFAQKWKSRQLRETDHDDFFARPQTAEFLALLRERNLLVSSTLRVGGNLIAVWIGFIYEGCWSGWIFTYDPAYRKFAAGHQLLASMLEESFRCGHREFDFSAGSDDYKLTYATHVRLLGTIGRPPLSRIVAEGAKNGLRQWAPGLFRTARRAKKAIGRTLLPRSVQAGGM
jgi:hypothetical protein